MTSHRWHRKNNPLPSHSRTNLGVECLIPRSPYFPQPQERPWTTTRPILKTGTTLPPLTTGSHTAPNRPRLEEIPPDLRLPTILAVLAPPYSWGTDDTDTTSPIASVNEAKQGIHPRPQHQRFHNQRRARHDSRKVLEQLGTQQDTKLDQLQTTFCQMFGVVETGCGSMRNSIRPETLTSDASYTEDARLGDELLRREGSKSGEE